MAFPARYLEFLAADERIDRFLVYYRPVDRDTGAVVELFHSTDAYGTVAGEKIPSQLFEAQLEAGFTFFGGFSVDRMFGIEQGSGGGLLTHVNVNGNLDSWRSQYYFDGREAMVFHGGWSNATGELGFDEYGTVFYGEVDGQPHVSLETVKSKLRAPDQRFDFPFSERVHCGLPWHVYFDGVNDSVSCGNNSAHNFTSAFTVRVRYLAQVVPGSGRPIIGRGVASTDGWRLNQVSSGKIRFFTEQSGASQFTESATALAAGMRHTITARLKADGSAQIFIDGELDAESAAGTHTMPATASRNLYWMRDNGGTVFLNGFVNEVALWNTALSDAEISDNAQRTLTSAERLESALVGYWPCDEGSGTTLTDQSPNANDGTIIGAVWYRALEGSADMEGEALPEWHGYCPGVPGVLVEANPPIWQLHSGKINSLVSASEGGLPRSGGDIIDFTSWAAFLAATTAAGDCDVLRTPGGTFARFNVPPTLPPTFEGQGDATDGTYRFAAAAIARLFLTTKGPNPLTDPTDLDETAWDDAETDQPAVQGLWWAEEMTIREAADWFLESCGFAVWRSRASGLFTIHRFAGAETAAGEKAGALATFTQQDVIVGSVESIAARAPAWEATILTNRNYFPLTDDQLNTSLHSGSTYNDLKRFLLKEWRLKRATNKSVKRLRLQARTLELGPSTFRWPADGRAEAVRRLDLADGEEQGLNLVTLPAGLQLDYFDPVYLHLQLEDEDGNPLDRLDTGATEAFVVLALGLADDRTGIRLTLYREDS